MKSLSDVLQKFRRTESSDRKVWLTRNLDTGLISISSKKTNAEEEHYVEALVRVWDVGTDHVTILNTKNDEYTAIPFTMISHVQMEAGDLT